jgi:hypothetical protein
MDNQAPKKEHLMKSGIVRTMPLTLPVVASSALAILKAGRRAVYFYAYCAFSFFR